jgi:hypothetical protein
MKIRRDKKGRFAAQSICYIDDNGYPRISAGPLRGMRIHRIIAACKQGKPLTKDQDVHHRDGDKLNFSPENLEILGHQEHGCVSAKQHHYLKEHDISLRSEWDEWFDAERQEGVQ